MKYTLEELRATRANSKTQEEVSDLLGIARSRFSQLEKDPRGMKILMICNLANIYKVTGITVYKAAIRTWKGDNK